VVVAKSPESDQRQHHLGGAELLEQFKQHVQNVQFSLPKMIACAKCPMTVTRCSSRGRRSSTNNRTSRATVGRRRDLLIHLHSLRFQQLERAALRLLMMVVNETKAAPNAD
jgi:hypothetical protein